jgi:protein O-mannosyl-transferase
MSNVSVSDPVPIQRPGARRAVGAATAPAPPVAAAPKQKLDSREVLLIAILLLVTCLCYANMVTNGFVYDDDQQILQNPYVKSWKFVPEIFSTTVWSFVGHAGATNYYRPLMTLTFLALWKLFGDASSGFHLFCLAMHLAVVLMVYLVGLRLLREGWMAWIGALLFAIHPVHTEVVDWIAAVPDLEATFFSLLALWLISDFEKPDWLAGSLAALALLGAVFAKEPSLLVAPLAVGFATLQYARNTAAPRLDLLRAVARFGPICGMGAAYLLLRIALFGKLAPVLQHPAISWSQAVFSAFALVLRYTELLFWPAKLSAFHVFHASTSLQDPRVLGGIAVVVAFSIVAAIAAFKRLPAIAFCTLWMSLTLLPVLNARWMAANVLTERYLYLPSVGFCWLAGWCAVQLWRAPARWPGARWPGATAAVRAAALLFLAGITTVSGVAIVRRNAIWHDDLSLYTQTLRTDPDAAIIRNNLAVVFYDDGNLERAETEWLTALAGKPDNVITMNSLGALYTREHKYSEAQEYLLQAIRTRPDWADAHYNYAITLQRTGKQSEALAEFERAIALAPVNPAARLWYGKALLEYKNYEGAETQFRRSFDLQPSPDATRGLADVYLQTGRNEKAAAALKTFLQYSPYDSEAHLQLAKLLEAAGDRAQAETEYRAVLLTDPSNTTALAALKAH